MADENKGNDKSGLIIGGTTLIGVGVGFILLEKSAMYFMASILIGIGLGLVLSPIFAGKK